ncbi:MAG: TlpA family protein disulfide reductase [Bacteroidaceae bacterium]|nr:TlpA family protein disulfide reductase [Bacteroidaceae bacterium]
MRYLLLLVFATLLSCGNKQTTTAAATATDTIAQPVVYENEYLVKVGDVAPDFSLPLTNGSVFKLSEHRGKIVMLQFTASWCGVCRREMPHIESNIWQKHKDNPAFMLIGVDREETKEVIDEYTAKVGTTYPMAIDSTGDVFASYAVRKSGITRNVLVGKDGRIVMLTRSFKEEEFNRLVATIDSLLAE